MIRTQLPHLFAILTAALLLAACLSMPAFAQDEPAPVDETAAGTAGETATGKEEQHTCIVTGMPWEASPTRVEAIFNIEGEMLRGYFVNLAYMYLLRDSLVADGNLVEIAQVKMLDYATFGTDHEQLILVDKFGGNIHLILVEEALPGTKEPFILAYSSEDAARAAIEHGTGRFNGEYLPWGKAVARIQQALQATEEEAEPSDAMGD